MAASLLHLLRPRDSFIVEDFDHHVGPRLCQGVVPAVGQTIFIQFSMATNYQVRGTLSGVVSEVGPSDALIERPYVNHCNPCACGPRDCRERTREGFQNLYGVLPFQKVYGQVVENRDFLQEHVLMPNTVFNIELTFDPSVVGDLVVFSPSRAGLHSIKIFLFAYSIYIYMSFNCNLVDLSLPSN
jgi:hypothetical protein